MSESEKPRIKPLFVVKAGTMSRGDIRRVEKLAGFCVVECSEPDAIRSVEPPVDAHLDSQARAALGLFRIVVRNNDKSSFYRQDLMTWFLNALIEPPPPSVPHVKPSKR